MPTQGKAKVNKKGNKPIEKDPFPHSVTRVPRSPLSSELEVKIPFTIVKSTTVTVAAFETQAYKINSLADANINYVGLAAYNAFYSKYRVVGVQMHIDALGVSGIEHYIGAYALSPLVTAVASATDVLSIARMPNAIGVTVGLNTGTSIERRVLAARMVNVAGTDEVETSDTYSAATSAVADPADLIYLHTAWRKVSGAGASALAYGFVIRGALNVRYFERRNILA